MLWFLDQYIWREEHKSKDDFEKPIEEWKDPECRDHTVILYKCLSNQRTTWRVDEEVENAEIVITTLNGVPRSWDSFIQGMCAIRKWLPSTNSGKSEHKKKIDS